ncbi:aminodeoxychorismate synthase [Malassezia psittaci]|uniref:aminodeoxychorismate synthase n=1 Tax=Malassezia psittaci TaxID=1821823 RepID=A0AAF0FCA2_9BASI|nr:aminodeoxychorismate synthase [Malassezia psittaci]
MSIQLDGMAHFGLPRIAIIDHHDSYTRNLLSLLCATLDLSASPESLANRVVIIPYTHPALAPENVHDHFLPYVDAIILSPGPGDPSNDEDFASSRRLLQNPSLVQVPILGICLGHQGIATSFGASTRQLSEPFHGRKRALVMEEGAEHSMEMRGILDDICPGTEVICYNSLVIDETTLPSNIRVVARSKGTSGEDSIIQAIEHTDLPYYGIQFHPESVESEGGNIVLRNFLYNVAMYWTKKDPERVSSWTDQLCALPPDLIQLGQTCVAPSRVIEQEKSNGKQYELLQTVIELPHRKTLNETLAKDMVSIVDTLFRKPKHSNAMGGCVWLDSASAKNPQSEISLLSRSDFTLSYDMSSQLSLCIQRADASVESVCLETGTDSLWDWMSDLQWDLQQATQSLNTEPIDANPEARPCIFPAGFVGYWGYEMKDESLDLGALSAHRYEHRAKSEGFDRMSIPAAYWAFCNKVLRYEHKTQTWTASVLVRRDTECSVGTQLGALEEGLKQLGGASIGVSTTDAKHWFDSVRKVITEVCSQPNLRTTNPSIQLAPLRAVDNCETYQKKINQAKEYIAQGKSYELCLTTQFEGDVSFDTHNYDAYFELYTNLRAINPAPFGAYLELLPLDKDTPQAILSTSPERFLTVTQDEHLEMRPIKGTLVRPGWSKGEEDWLQQAFVDPEMQKHVQEEDERRKAKLRADPKERAENLMIADLIRADLQAVCYPGSVQVPRLISLETYETVHQLVTSVTGKLRPGIGCVEAAKRCFPPGSMTGAPKRRSVELLETLEKTPGYPQQLTRRRCIYSGALGFMGVTGTSNLSVVIRTVFAQGSNVIVGAGGAVTILSSAQGEWDEVLTKLSSVASLAA